MKLAGKYLAFASALALFICPAVAQNTSQSTTPDAAAPARTIMIHAKRYEFVPDEITLQKDQTVKLELTSDDVEHSLVVPGLEIDGKMTKGQVTDVIVTPTKVGDFRGRCGIYCGIDHRKMHFTVHVVN